MKGKRILNKATILNSKEPPNTKTKTRTLGEVEVKFVSLDDMVQITGLLERIKDGREFTASVLHRQLKKPKISIEKLLGLPDNELRKLARDFITNEYWLFKYFNETTDTEFFDNFRKAIKERYSKEAELLRSNLEPIIKSAKNALDTFHRQFAHIQVPRIQIPTFQRELGTTLSEFASQVAKSQLRIAESVRSVARQWESTARLISEAVRPQIEIWQKWAEQNRSIFQNIATYWKEFEQKYKITEREAARILRKYKWLITPSLPVSFLFDVVKIGRKRGNQRGTMNKLFAKYFLSDNCKNLEGLVNEWERNPLFKPRLKILKDCVSVIKNADRKFNPSNFVLPTLVAQIDGIRLEFMNRNGITFWANDNRWRSLCIGSA